MTEKNRVVLYASEKEGENIPRPQLEHIIQRAAERPRPFDIVTVERVQVFGTNEEARDAIARLAEHGVTVSPVTGGLGPYGWNERPGRLVKWIAESEDEDLNEEERKERELIAKAITAQDTFRVVLDRTKAVQALEKTAPVPQNFRRNLEWPTAQTIYLEYARPIILDKIRQEDSIELMQGLIVMEGTEPREVITVFTTEGTMELQKVRVDLKTETGIYTTAKAEEFQKDVEEETARAITHLSTLLLKETTIFTDIPVHQERENTSERWVLAEPIQ